MDDFFQIDRATFTAPISDIKDVHNKEQLCEISHASLDNLKSIIGNEIDFEKNIDLLSVAFPITVVNQINENGEALVSPIAKEIKEYFKHKPTNIEHKPEQVVGHMVNLAFNELETYKTISDSKILKRKDPFYLSASAVLYKMANKSFIDLLKRTVDPEDGLYQYVSASWEVIFKYYAIAVGSKNIEDCEIYTDPKDILKYKKYLKKFGGKGVTSEGVPVGRIVLGPALPVGIGFTANPAAQVKGVAVDLTSEDVNELIDKKTSLTMPYSEIEEIFNTANKDYSSDNNEDILKIFEKSDKNISQLEEKNVNTNKPNTMEITDLNKKIEELASKITSQAEDLDAFKSEKARANVVKVIEEALKEGNKEWIEKIEAEKASAQEEKEAREKLSTSLASLEEEMKGYKAKVEALEAEKSEASKQELINSRMDAITEEYELSSAAKKAIISQVKDLPEDEKAFDAFKSDTLEVLYASFNKENIEKAKAEREKEIEDKAKELVASEVEKVKASLEKSGLSYEEILSKASADTELPNSSNSQEEGDIIDKLAKKLNSQNISVK